MAKRLTSTDVWKEDWFIELPVEYKLFWFYILSMCDQGGFFKINIISFNKLNSVEVDSETAFELINKGKKRLRKINGSMWLVEDFFKFQYGIKFNPKSPVHSGVEKIFNQHGISISTLRGIDRV
jgi:hypothetical protein